MLDQHQLEACRDYKEWDSSNKSEAQQILSSETSFAFITVFLTVYQYLSHMAGITVKLQKSSLDIIDAHNFIEEVKHAYQHERENIDKDDGYGRNFQMAVTMAEKV